jgi:ABC-type nitrate/sulfonate/bicarbonate transport system permease component
MTGLVPPVETTASATRHVVLRSATSGVGRALLSAVITVAIVLAVWVVFLEALDVSEYVGKGPSQVWDYLFVEEDASENLAEVRTLVGITLVDALIGFGAGMVGALLLAGAIVLSRTAEGAIMPVALLLRSVPLIAMTPVIRMVFGTGSTLTIAIIAGIVVLFPALVTIVFGLRSTSPQMHDVVAVYGGTPLTALLKVDIPSALPSFFAAVRISVPGAITGALIAEWLGGTGDGVGYEVVSALGRAQNTKVWALVIVITFVSLFLYTIAQVVESFVLARFGTEAGRA